MKVSTACALLELELLNHQPDIIREAFQRVVKARHPDNGGMGADMDQLKAARDTLLNRRNVDEFACRTCKGTGSVRYRMGTRPCGACKGTGDGNGS